MYYCGQNYYCHMPFQLKPYTLFPTGLHSHIVMTCQRQSSDKAATIVTHLYLDSNEEQANYEGTTTTSSSTYASTSQILRALAYKYTL